jgi:phosphate transport system permease protein
VGTLNVVFWALLVAIPVGLASAIYLSEYASPRSARIIKPVLEVLAGIPTVAIGLFAFWALRPAAEVACPSSTGAACSRSAWPAWPWG